MEKYSILDGKSFLFDEYEIASVSIKDALPIMNWRNQQIDALRQKDYLTEKNQLDYFHQVVQPQYSKSNPDPLLMGFTKEDELIGYGGLVHIDWNNRRAEVSFLLESKRAKNLTLYKEELKVFFSLIKELAFDHLGLNKLSTESYAHRQHHVMAIEESGFVREGILRQQTMIDGQWVDAVIASCLCKDYLPVK